MSVASPPATPGGSPYLSHSVSSHHSHSHSHSSPNLLTPCSSLGQHTEYRPSGSSTRPGTPTRSFPFPSTAFSKLLDMPSSAAASPRSDLAQTDSSDILSRPSVESDLKGVPQGWEDDPSVPVPTPLTNNPPTTSPPRAQVPFPSYRSRSAVRPGLQSSGSQQHHTRLNSFRGLASYSETRSKLSTWRDKTFPDLLEGRRRRTGAAFEGLPSKGAEARARPYPPDLSLSTSTTPQALLDSTSTAIASTTELSSGPARLGVSVASQLPTTSTLNSIAPTPANGGDPFASSKESLPPASSSLAISIGNPSSTAPSDARSMTSTHSSSSTRNRERVMGLRPDVSQPNITASSSRFFSPPDVHDVLPFASSRLYSAWDHPQSQPHASAKASSSSPVKANIRTMKGRRASMSLSIKSEERSSGGRFGSASTASGLLVSHGAAEETVEGWKDLPMPVSGTGMKRVWIGADGQQLATVYRVGWEREVMDVEARLHEAMYELAGGKHSLIALKDEDGPKTVLDIGTGLGLWPVSQALIWRQAKFVGLDLVPCQLDRAALSRAEQIARSSSASTPAEEGLWEGVEKRITWDQADFLTTLPYDSGVFDMVHLRFLSLGLSESAWPALLDEALRVLAPGGHIEIVELSTCLPSTAPASLHRSFASMLLADMINPDPSLPIQFALPILEGLQSGMGRPVLETASDEDGVFGEAAWAWVRSALDHKGTGIERAGGKDETMVRKIRKGLGGRSRLWGWDEVEERGTEVVVAPSQGPKVWVWVGRKK